MRHNEIDETPELNLSGNSTPRKISISYDTSDEEINFREKITKINISYYEQNYNKEKQIKMKNQIEYEYLMFKFTYNYGGGSSYGENEHKNLLTNKKYIRKMWFLNENEKIKLIEIRLLQKWIKIMINQNVEWKIDEIRKLPTYLIKNRTYQLIKEKITLMPKLERKSQTELVEITLFYQAQIIKKVEWKRQKDGLLREKIDYYQKWNKINKKLELTKTGYTNNYKSTYELRLNKKEPLWYYYLNIENKNSAQKGFEKYVNMEMNKNEIKIELRNMINEMLENKTMIREKIME